MAEDHLQLTYLVRTAVETKSKLSSRELRRIAKRLGDCPFRNSLSGLYVWTRTFFSESTLDLLWQAANFKVPQAEMMFAQAGCDVEQVRRNPDVRQRYTLLVNAMLPRKQPDGSFVMAMASAGEQQQKQQQAQAQAVMVVFESEDKLREALENAVAADERASKTADMLTDHLVHGQQIMNEHKHKRKQQKLSKEEKMALDAALQVRTAAFDIMPASSRPFQAATLDLSLRWKLYDHGVDFIRHARQLGARCSFVSLGSGEGSLSSLSAMRVISFPRRGRRADRWLCYDAYALEAWLLDMSKQSTLQEAEVWVGEAEVPFPGSSSEDKDVLEAVDVRRLAHWVEALRALERLDLTAEQRDAIGKAAAHLMPSTVVDQESGWLAFMGRKLYDSMTHRYALGSRQAVYAFVQGAEWFLNWVPRILTLSLFVAVVRTIICLVTKFFVLNIMTAGTALPSFIVVEATQAIQHLVAQLGIDAARALWQYVLGLPDVLAASPAARTTLTVAVLAWLSSKLGLRLGALAKRVQAGKAAVVVGGGIVGMVALGVAGTGSGALSQLVMQTAPSTYGIFAVEHVKDWALSLAAQMPLLNLASLTSGFDSVEGAAQRVSAIASVISSIVCRVFGRAEPGCRKLFTLLAQAGVTVYLVSSVADVVYNLGVLAVAGIHKGSTLFTMPCLRSLSATVHVYDLSREVRPHEEGDHPSPIAAAHRAETLGEVAQAGSGLDAHAHLELREPRMQEFERFAGLGPTLSQTRAQILHRRRSILDDDMVSKLTRRDGNPYHSAPMLSLRTSKSEQQRLMRIYERGTVHRLEEAVEASRADARVADELLALARAKLAARVEATPRTDLSLEAQAHALVELARTERVALQGEIREDAAPSLWTRTARFFRPQDADKTRHHIRSVMRIEDEGTIRKLVDATLVVDDAEAAAAAAHAEVNVRQDTLRQADSQFKSMRGDYTRFEALPTWRKFLEGVRHTTWSDFFG